MTISSDCPLAIPRLLHGIISPRDVHASFSVGAKLIAPLCPNFSNLSARFVTADQKDTAPVNSFEGFQSNGAVVLRDRRGTAKAEIPEVTEKGFGGGDPLAIYKPTGAKSVSPAKAMASFNGWTFAAVNAIAREISNIQFRLYQVKGETTTRSRPTSAH